MPETEGKDTSPRRKPYSPATLKKRDKILRKSLKLFAREGFQNADVQVIADLAGVGKGTIYRHFGNKHELFLATAQASMQWQAEYVSAAAQGTRSAAELLRRIAIACGEYYQLHPEAIEIMIQERAEFRESVFPTVLMFRSQGAGSLDVEIREAMQRGEFRQSDPALVVNTFFDLLIGCAVCGCLGGGRSTLAQRFEDEVGVFLAGLLPA